MCAGERIRVQKILQVASLTQPASVCCWRDWTRENGGGPDAKDSMNIHMYKAHAHVRTHVHARARAHTHTHLHNTGA